MGRTALAWVIVFFLLSTAGFPAAEGGDSRTFSGKWTWGEVNGKLEATFTPTGDDTWDVVFRFEFRDKPRVFGGTASGSLTDGALEGTVRNEAGDRTFRFHGSFEAGTFQGTHGEVEDGEEHETGTVTFGDEGPDDGARAAA